MTKKRELELLDEFVKKLDAEGPGGSYLAPWLRAVRPSIENALRADVSPSIYAMDLAEFRKHLDTQLDTCRQQCKEMRDAAEARSKKCQANSEEIINEAYDALRAAMKKLEDYR